MRANRLVLWCTSGVLALSLGATLVGCGGGQATQSAATENNQTNATQVEAANATQAGEQNETTETDDRKVLGTESADAAEVALTNGLDGKITSLKLRASGEESYSKNLIAKKTSIAQDEEVRLFVDASNAKYDLLVTKKGEDGQKAEVEFNGIRLAKMPSAKLVEEGDLAFVEYTNAAGKQGSTKKAAEKEKAAAEEEAAKAAAQEQAQSESEASAEAYTYEEPVYYEEPSYDSYDYSAPVEAPAESAPAQTSDGCTGDIEWR